ncbi:hypothetical protein PHMEG_000669 [Phytophthora megakarya]|uniref:PDZ domain-containing protein n=1 Tax=Phytophthora megakarya TaxID=4795 RepID=A0A225X4N6_9STRA|nr:hypothetical protein PHMEG_000669 [Phytophthora megakarya]
MGERKGIYFGAIDASAGDLVPSSVRNASSGGRMASNLEAAIRAGNVNVSDNVATEVLELSESSRAAQEKHALLLRRIEAEKRARNIAVPTNVEEVIRRLRQLGEPITLFGERPADRRERLREILSRLELEAEETGFVHQVLADIQQQEAGAGEAVAAGRDERSVGRSAKPQEDQLFYVPIKNDGLKSARTAMFAHTTTVVGARLKRERQERHMMALLMVLHGFGVRPAVNLWRYCKDTRHDWLLLQEGHYKEVYAIAFQKDGALVATGDLNGNGRVWDLRSGKAILPLQGHSKQILSMDFAANGVQLASGSDDRSVRIWDLRQQKCSYMVPAHSNLVSDIRFSPGSGELLLSASYDSSIKLWRTRDWSLLTTLRGHDGKVMSADFAPDEKHIVSCGFDRTFKLWAHENELVLILALISIFVHANFGDVASAKECSLEAQQFSVVVATSAPLGLRLSEKLEVLEFVTDSEGRGRAVEASGLAEIGDRLIGVNDVSLEGFTLQKAVGELQTAQLPRILRFQTHDGRCVQPPPTAVKESIIEAATATAVTYDPTNEETFDYVVSSVGDKTTELKLYAVLSSDGSPPSCDFRELVLARPFDACAPLSVNVTDKYVLIPSVLGCPMHQKAALADEAGAKGVVFVQRVGEKPMRLQKLEENADIDSGEDSNTHIHVEFSGENALEHQWKELASLAVESNWPTTEAARDRLFHRMLKDQATLDDHDLQLALVKNERYEALVASYWNAQRYYSARDQASKDKQGDDINESEDDR